MSLLQKPQNPISVSRNSLDINGAFVRFTAKKTNRRGLIIRLIYSRQLQLVFIF